MTRRLPRGPSVVLVLLALTGCPDETRRRTDAGSHGDAAADASAPIDAAVDADGGADAGADAGTPCSTDAECVAGWTCPAEGGGAETCSCTPAPETCNGRDDDCDGTVDEPAALVEQCASACVDGACPSVAMTTWLRSTDEGTELLVLGSTTPLVATTAPRRIVRAFVEHDGSTTWNEGTYEIGSDGSGSYVVTDQYLVVREPSKAWVARAGATRARIREMARLTILADGSDLLATLDAFPQRFTSLASVVDAIDPSTEAGATDLLVLVLVAQAIADVRTPGSDGGGIVQYTQPRTFPGFASGSVGITVESAVHPNTTYVHDDDANLPGITVDGQLLLATNVARAGTWSGVATFLASGLTGTVDYTRLQVANGYFAGGTFAISVGAEPAREIAYSVAYDLDLRSALPVETP